MKKLVRTLQTYFPFALEVKAAVQRQIRSTLKIPSEDTFRLFEHFPFSADQVFIDVGGNRGQTLASFRLFRKTVPAHCFEPNPIMANKIRQLYGKDPNIFIHNVGLGDANGTFDLYVPSYRGFYFDGLASFDYESAASWLNSDRIFAFDAKKVTIQKINCKVARLDDFNLNPALIKIDVQGLEESVLRGGLETINRTRPSFIIENDKDRMGHAALLKSLKYVMSGYRNGRLYLNEMGHDNSVYLPEESAERIVAAYPTAHQA